MSDYVIQTQKLNYSGAAAILAAAVAEAEKIGVPVVIVIMDPAGQ